MATLNRNNSNWSFEERRKINENWDILEGLANSTASSNNGLKSEVDQLKITVGQNTNRITNSTQLINQANVKSDSAITLANTALSNSNQAKNLAEVADDNANQANSKSDNAVLTANEASSKFNSAVSTANQASLKSDNAVSRANEANLKSDNAVSTANQANLKSAYVQSQLDSVIANGDSSAEVVQARKGKPTLRERLDDEYDTVTSELEQTNDELIAREITPLLIQTFDGSNEPFHPDVKYFANGWSGWKYWMAYTPYPLTSRGYQDRWECPCIAVSNDGVSWRTPVGFANPLADLTQEQINNLDYFSDTCIVFINNRMEVWYRLTNGADTTDTKTYRVTSTNGVTWSAPQLVQDSKRSDVIVSDGVAGNFFRSQTVSYENGVYYAFYCTDDGMYVIESTDPATGVWTNRRKLKRTDGNRDVSYWHANVIKDDGVYRMIGYYQQGGKDDFLDYLTSTDKVNWTFVKRIIQVDARTLSNLNGLYQSSAVKISATEWRIYASCNLAINSTKMSKTNKNGLFMMAGESLDKVVPSDLPRTSIDDFKVDGSIILPNKDASNNQNHRLQISGSVDANDYGAIGVKYLDGIAIPTHIYKGDLVNNLASLQVGYGAPSRYNFFTEFYFDANGEALYMSVADRKWIKFSTKDPKEFTYDASRGDVRLNSEIPCTGRYRVVVNEVENDVPISSIRNGVEGQDIILLNAIGGRDITISHNAPGASYPILLRNKTDYSLATLTTLKLHFLNGRWFEV